MLPRSKGKRAERGKERVLLSKSSDRSLCSVSSRRTGIKRKIDNIVARTLVEEIVIGGRSTGVTLERVSFPRGRVPLQGNGNRGDDDKDDERECDYPSLL